MGNCDVTFCDNDVFHDTLKAVLPEDCAKVLLQHESTGNEIYQEFVRTRLQGNESIWSTITKRKLKTMKKKVDGRVIQLREEKSLLSRFVTTSRKRPELNLEHRLGNFEVTVFP